MSETTSARMVLLDRDGTINAECHYLSSPDQVELLPGSAEAIGLLREGLGLPIAVVTNQSGIARGYFDDAALAEIHGRLNALLGHAGQSVDGYYHCPHHPDERCACRKPEPGMALRAAADWGADLSRSFVVGDNVCDIELGERVGAMTILVRTGHGKRTLAEDRVHPDHVVDDLLAAAHVIESVVEREAAVCP
ncbi:MAG: HAD family hydrolase [Solirubrobacteraceae bacterium]